MMRAVQFFTNKYSKATTKHRCETDGCSSQSSTSLESKKSYRSGRSPGTVHPVAGDAHPCASCKDNRIYSHRYAVNFSTAQPLGMITNSTTVVPGQVSDGIEGQKSSEPVPHPVGIIKSGPSWRIDEGRMPQLQRESFPSPVTPRSDPNSMLDGYASEDLINSRSTELTRDLTGASTSQGRLSVSATSYPTLQRPNHEISIACDTKAASKTSGLPGPPPPRCSLCYNEHHFGYSEPSKRFSSEELKIVTDNFSLDRKFNGSKDDDLYRGELDGRSVFVFRKETEEPSDYPADYFPEVDILEHVQHPYIVTLRGFLDEEKRRALVFNFVCNGTLSYHLSPWNPNILQWPYRVALAVNLAEGLDYLHDRSVIHGNVNAKNIFVTHDFKPVIGEFSFSRNIAGVKDVILQNRCEQEKAGGYLPLEYDLEYQAGRKLSEKHDIYAFGVILFELISGRAPSDKKNRTTLGEWGREKVKEFEGNSPYKLVEAMADPRLDGSNYNKDEMLKMINVAALCTSKDPRKRPLIPKVLEMLTGKKDTNSEQKQAAPSAPPMCPSALPPAVPTRPHWPDHDSSVMEPWSSSDIRAPSPAQQRTYSADPDTHVVETGSATRSTYNDHNAAGSLQLLGEHFQTEKSREKCSRPLNFNPQRAPQASQSIPDVRTDSASKSPVPLASISNCNPAKTCPATIRRNLHALWDRSQKRPKSTQKRPQTPAHVLLKKKQRSSDTHRQGNGSSTQYGRSPKTFSARKVSYSSKFLGISMPPRSPKLTWYKRKSGGANSERPSEGKERRVTWTGTKRRPRPTCFNFHFSFNEPY